jgi:hypothetical protein
MRLKNRAPIKSKERSAAEKNIKVGIAPTAKGMQNRTGFSELMDYEGKATTDGN